MFFPFDLPETQVKSHVILPENVLKKDEYKDNGRTLKSEAVQKNCLIQICLWKNKNRTKKHPRDCSRTCYRLFMKKTKMY